MNYQISRDGQLYGPYTLEDLQRYLASGNILPSDLAKTEEMTEWLPVSQILASGGPLPPAPPAADFAPVAPTPAYTGFNYGSTAYGGPPSAVAIAASPYPDAPNLHWALVMLFAFFTCSLFMYIWNIVIAAWLKRVQPSATSLYYYAAVGVLFVLERFVSMRHALHTVFGSGMHTYVGGGTGASLLCLWWIVRLIARFTQRASLEEHFNTVEPVGLRLSGVMTFFFGGLYFQYKLNEINSMKQAARYASGPPRTY